MKKKPLRKTGRVYKVWIDIEEYDIASEHGVLLDSLTIPCTATFATEEEAVKYAERINAHFEQAGPVQHI